MTLVYTFKGRGGEWKKKEEKKVTRYDKSKKSILSLRWFNQPQKHRMYERALIDF